MKQRKAVTRETLQRYCRASRREKSRILEQYTKLTKYHRKYALGLLNGTQGVGKASGDSSKQHRGRPRIYTQSVLEALRHLWAMFNFMCGRRLAPAIRVNLVVLEKFRELRGLDALTRERLLRLSPATIDRLLADDRKKLRLKGRSHTRPGSLRRDLIPIRTFGKEDQKEPGYVEVDLVAHDGGSSRGEYAQTLTLTDVDTGWTEVRGVRNKAQKWVFPALKFLVSLLPFALKGLNADNGGEFINVNLLNWCQLNHVAFTRSRPYRKNDNPYVEQKNNSVVRTAVGYMRYDTQEELRLLNQIYAQTRLLINFFYPSMKLKEKIRIGARVKKRYDVPKTPYQRVLDSPYIEEAAKEKLRKQFAQLNPAAITRALASLQEQLMKKASLKQRLLDSDRGRALAAAG
jgi:hypothetical protein